jgi:hypothetical protein
MKNTQDKSQALECALTLAMAFGLGIMFALAVVS